MPSQPILDDYLPDGRNVAVIQFTATGGKIYREVVVFSETEIRSLPAQPLATIDEIVDRLDELSLPPDVRQRVIDRLRSG